MKRIIPFLFALVFLFTSCSSKKVDLLIVNATIIDVTSGTVSEGKLIAISGDTIRFVDEAANQSSYQSDQAIDLENKFVMPALWDNHVHFRGGQQLIEENKDLLPLFLAYGITTVRDAGGDMTPSVLEWRNQVLSKSIDAPMIFTSGPKLDGETPAWDGSIKVTSDADVLMALDSLEAIGADFIKMYDGSLTKEMFYAIIKEAEKRGLKTTGHMPLSANFLEAVEYGLDGSEHLYYPMKACSPLADSLTALGIGYGMMGALAESYDPQLAQEVFEKLGENEVYVTPTLFIGKVLREILDVDHKQDSLLNYIGTGIQETYLRRIASARRARERGTGFRDKLEGVFSNMIVPMYNAEVTILAGSDCGAFNSFTYPGESLHGELFSLVKAGLTPQQALSTSVINGPKFFDLQDYYGSVERGKVADLLILNKNPLEDIAAIGSMTFLIAKGNVYNRGAINKLRQEVK